MGGGRSRATAPRTEADEALDDALALETELGLEVIRSGETAEGATRFADGAGRHGAF